MGPACPPPELERLVQGRGTALTMVGLVSVLASAGREAALPLSPKMSQPMVGTEGPVISRRKL